MLPPAARPFNPKRLWPTAFAQADRIRRLLITVAVLNFLLNAFAVYLPPTMVFFAWLLGATFVGVATTRIEKFMAKHRRGIT